jgi:hypothetical protein
MKFNLFLLLVVLFYGCSTSTRYLFEQGGVTTIFVDSSEQEPVHTAFELLQQDVEQVVGARLLRTDNAASADIVVTTSRRWRGQWERFSLQTRKNGRKLVISGSDARAKAYGIMELSKLLGVSPWYFFADVKPVQLPYFKMPRSLHVNSPSVKYRGIFLNDEDWGLMPWATRTLAPHSAKGAMGPEVYARIFELMLRLKANTIWPAMHECTVPFYQVEGNRQIAEKYGIIVGTSHCEPLARNSAGEWDIDGVGDYNFITNRNNVINYWAERLEELQTSENIFTVGMRGKHDGMMQGVKTLEEHKAALTEIIPVQQGLIKQYINKDPSQVPQAFIPYKEVLDVYNDGLHVPDHVTLIWCDDNYGYIRRLSDEAERRRSGGSGIYYHVSYWGRPHDYLWLATTSPSLIYTEMNRAYEYKADRMWILNVGDIKPAEYLTEFFLDMAWDVKSVEPGFAHLEKWMEREFGSGFAQQLTAIKKEYYRLASFRKPEWMGWSRVEEPGFHRGRTPVYDTEYNPLFNNELQRRLDDHLQLQGLVDDVKKNIPENRQSAFFQLIEYPVYGASLMNKKWLYAQLARYWAIAGEATKAFNFASLSNEAYDGIVSITEHYNQLEEGKWNRMMSFNPRSLAVFDRPDFSKLDSLISHSQLNLLDEKIKYAVDPASQFSTVLAKNAVQADNITSVGTVVEGLGHSFAAVQLPKGKSLSYSFLIGEQGEYWIKVAAIPNHDVDEKGLFIQLSVDGTELGSVDYKSRGRSEIWKQNVLRGQALVTFEKVLLPKGIVELELKALTDNVQLDQLAIGKGDMNFYEFPVD